MNTIVEIEPKSRWEHISIILTGLEMLSQQNKIKLIMIDNSKEKSFSYSNDPGQELIINGKKCYIDVADGYNNLQFMKSNVNNYYLYFKRSYNQTINNQYGFNNILPLGLNYEVYDKRIKYNWRCSSFKKKLKNLFQIKLNHQYYLKDYEYNGLYNIDKPKICFFCRLWDGKNNKELNQKRIELIKKLKEKYKNSFCGGVYDNKLARKLCPKLIVGKVLMRKQKYLKKMHRCDICVATTGLHKSIGWKFAEYVIAGKVILSERLNYELPGDFAENENYLVFNTVEECIKKIDNIIENKAIMKKISDNNLRYYENYLRPDKQMIRVINMVNSNNGE